jgi:hypothetical protein
MDELLASSRAGLTPGDPFRLYLWPVIPQGGILDHSAAILAAWGIWQSLLAARDTYVLGRSAVRDIKRLLLERVEEGQTTLLSDTQAWYERLQRLQDFYRYLDTGGRNTADVASLLGCTHEEASNFLMAIGFVLDESSGGWRLATTEEPEYTLAETMEFLRTQDRRPTSEDLEAILTRYTKRVR